MREYYNLPANFNQRLHAFFFDFGLISLVVLITIFMQYKLEYEILSIGVIWISINYLLLLQGKRQSLGKYFSKIRVVDLSNNDVSIKTYLLRALFIYVASILSSGIYLFVGLFVAEQNVEKRSIHDYIFKTKVVRNEVFVSLTE